MKIAHVVCVFPPYRGGIGKSALDFSIMMAEKGHSVDVLTPLYTRGNEDDNFSLIKIKRLKTFFKLGNGAFIPSLFFSLRKYDLVYFHYPFFGTSEILWLFSFFNKKTKIILHYHMDVLGLSPFFKFLSLPSRLIEKSLLRRVDLITVASFDYIEKSDIANFYLNNKSKFRETYFPVDIKRFHPLENKKNNKVKQIIFVGGLDKAHYFKGLRVLLESLASLKGRSDWSLEIVGRGELENDYRKTATELGIVDRVQFNNSLSDEQLALKYRESDFFVLPSINRGEAFGIVLLEAMASGLPVIASNLSGVRRVFSEDEGFLVKPGDIGDLSSKIEYLLDNDWIIKEKSNKARELVVSKYSYRKISERLNKIVSEIKNENLSN